MSVTRATSAVSSRQRLWLAACVGLIGAPHALHLPLWASAAAGVLLAWQLWAARINAPVPTLWIRGALTLAAFVGVFAGFGRINGATAGVALLVFMLLIKLCEMRSHRDIMMVLTLACFLLATQFLFSQNLAMALYLALGVWLLIGVFVQANMSESGRARTAGREALWLMLLALPVAAALFILFPRIPGPLWGLPDGGGGAATTGLSDSMRPGSVAALAQSDAVALRARFPDGRVPPPAARYWRGPVFWDFDSGRWHTRGEAPARRPPEIRGGRALGVDITLAPSRQRWLIALDVPVAADRRSELSTGATLLSAAPIDQRIRYIARSRLGAALDARLTPAAAARARRLPAAGNPRARALAARWERESTAPAEIVQRALHFFREQAFFYTLTPPPVGRGGDGIDAFLFDTRHGFCEHYAGAFTFLMRAAGLPARVVTGYQGAAHSTLGDYWIVRNSDAHAWSEVWLSGQGWVRVDPTAAVDPARVNQGIGAAMGDTAGSPLPFMARGGGSGWYQARMLWDAIDAGWNRWFLAYGPALQQRLLGALGLAGLGAMVLALTLSVAGLLVLVSLALAWRMRTPGTRDPVQRAWQRIDRRLTAIGLARAPAEGPIAFGERVAAERSDLAADIRALCADYARLRYAPRPANAYDGRRAAFMRAARSFSPRRSRRWQHRSKPEC